MVCKAEMNVLLESQLDHPQWFLVPWNSPGSSFPASRVGVQGLRAAWLPAEGCGQILYHPAVREVPGPSTCWMHSSVSTSPQPLFGFLLCSSLALVSIFFSLLYVEELLEISFLLQEAWSNVHVLRPLALSEPELAPVAERSMKKENSSAALGF